MPTFIHKIMPIMVRVLVPLIAVSLTACQPLPLAPATTAVALNHLVLIKLKNPLDRAALEIDSNSAFVKIPQVIEFSIAHPVDLGRPSVDSDYDVAIFIVFSSIEAYQAYLKHPAHIALVTAWKEKFQSMRAYDFAK